MDLSTASLWWLAAGAVVAAELATNTFYLLMIALGMAAGAVAAQLDASLAVQITMAALAGGGATALWHWKRARQPQSAPARENRDVNLDIGAQIEVLRWEQDLTTRVQYRGSTWAARLLPDAPVAVGAHRVVAIDGNWLVLAPLPDR